MIDIATKFINDHGNTDKGWAAPFRAPGVSTIKSIHNFDYKSRDTASWWDQSHFTKNFGGCGAVMHAHPFGIFFHNKTQDAIAYAVAHAKITHAHPWSLAACAAMAAGVAIALASPQVNAQNIIKIMQEAAIDMTMALH
jgi:ADP-ribosylglycohydrolase